MKIILISLILIILFFLLLGCTSNTYVCVNGEYQDLNSDSMSKLNGEVYCKLFVVNAPKDYTVSIEEYQGGLSGSQTYIYYLKLLDGTVVDCNGLRRFQAYGCNYKDGNIFNPCEQIISDKNLYSGQSECPKTLILSNHLMWDNLYRDLNNFTDIVSYISTNIRDLNITIADTNCYKLIQSFEKFNDPREREFTVCFDETAKLSKLGYLFSEGSYFDEITFNIKK